MSIRSIVLGTNATVTPTIAGTTTNTALALNNIVLLPPADPLLTTGSILLAFITADTGSSAFTSSGWTEVYGSGSFAGGYARQTCLYRKLNGPPAASYTFSTSGAANISGMMVGVKNANDIASSATSTFSTTAVTSHNAPSLVGLFRALEFCGFGFNTVSSLNITAPAGYPALYAGGVNNGQPTIYRTTYVAYRQLLVDGATGIKTATTVQSVQSFVGSVIVV